MASQTREKSSTFDYEVESQDLHLRSKVKLLRLVDGARLGLTALALLMGISILGVSADALSVYNATHVSGDLLSLWPAEFDLRPAIALVVGAAIVTVTNIVSVVFSKVPLLRSQATVHSSLTFAAPFVGLVAAVIAMVFFYVVNASETVDTLLSWTCRWQAVSMSQSPHFSSLCRQSWAGVYLSVLLIPVEAFVLVLAGWQMSVERHTAAYSQARKTPSPIMA